MDVLSYLAPLHQANQLGHKEEVVSVLPTGPASSLSPQLSRQIKIVTGWRQQMGFLTMFYGK